MNIIQAEKDLSPFIKPSRTAGLHCLPQQKTEYKKANRTGVRKQSSTSPAAVANGSITLESAVMSGSITLEAALTLPLFLMIMTGFLAFFLFMALEMKMQGAMEIVGQKIAAYMYVSDCFQEAKTTEKEKAAVLEEIGIVGADLVVTDMTAKGLVINEMDGFFAPESLVDGGTKGVSFLGSFYDRDKKDLILKASYRLKIPFLPFSEMTLPISQQSYHHIWTGKKLEPRTEEEVVYFTVHGEVYHTHLDCSYLKLSVREVPLSGIHSRRNLDGSRYQMCEVCGKIGGETVFITEYGDCYHFDRNCTGLKRGIKSAPISSVGNMKECSRCRKRGEK